jgi:hypothetical protein
VYLVSGPIFESGVYRIESEPSRIKSNCWITFLLHSKLQSVLQRNPATRGAYKTRRILNLGLRWDEKQLQASTVLTLGRSSLTDRLDTDVDWTSLVYAIGVRLHLLSYNSVCRYAIHVLYYCIAVIFLLAPCVRCESKLLRETKIFKHQRMHKEFFRQL